MTIKAVIASQFDDTGLKKAQKSFGGLGASIKGALGVIGITASLSAITSGLINASKAATEDAKSSTLLAQQLRNTIGATDEQIASVEASIKAMQLQAAVADDEIRPAFAQLTRATGDVGKATSLTALALDVSAGTGRDLNAVAIALSKAYQGNTTALSRLGIKAKDGVNVFDQLKTQFAGSAEAAAQSDPYQRLNVIFGEIQEQIGVALLPKLNEIANYLSDPKRQAEISSYVNLFVEGFQWVTTTFAALIGGFKSVGYAFEQLGKGNFGEFFKVMGMDTIDAAAYVDKMRGTTKKAADEFKKFIPTISDFGYQTHIVGQETGRTTSKIEKNTAAIKASQAAQKKHSEERIKYWEGIKAAREALQAETDALNESKTSITEATSALKSLSATQADIGEFESKVVDSFGNIKSAIESAIDNKSLTTGQGNSLLEYLASTQTAIAAIAKQRDALAAKRSLVETLIGDVKGSLLGAGNLTNLLETTSKTVTKTVTSIVNGLQVAVSSTTEEITSGGLLANFKSVLAKTKAFADQLKQLRKLGLDQNLFKQIVDAGAEAGGAIAAEIIAGGADSVRELNGVYKDLADVSGQVAEQTAVVLYNDGKDVAGGLVAGLLAQEEALKSAAQQLADAFISTFNSMIAKLVVPTASNAFTSSNPTLANYISAATEGLSGQQLYNQYAMLSGADVSAPGSFRNVASNVNITVNAGVGTNGKAVGEAILTSINQYKAANGGSL